jgi:hypothetical protein
MTSPATIGRTPILEFVRWYMDQNRLDVLLDDAGTERLIVVEWSGDGPPEHWLNTAVREVEYQRNQEAQRAIRGLTPGDLGG